MTDNDLIQLLNAHGQIFMQSFERMPAERPGKRKREVPEAEPEEEEWAGITEIHPSRGSSDEEEDLTDSGDEDDYDLDDDLTAESPTSRPSVVVFDDISSPKSAYDPISKCQKKAFMSSNVSKIKDEIQSTSNSGNGGDSVDEEKTNLQNDALLHRLVHTKLLSGSLNEDLNMTPAQRKKALAGRVLELSGSAQLGKGEKSVRRAERSKHAKRVRMGLIDKEKERQKAQMEEAKNMGNYHRSIKKLFEDPDGKQKKRERERGLRMGVGKFKHGMLSLSREEITQVNGQSRGMTGRRGRVGGGGRGRP